MTKTVLSTTYFGSVEWYNHLYRSDETIIEQWETFQKQTYRNRCVISTATGTQTLVVPVEHSVSRLIRDIRISDHGNWPHQHWNAIRSAYGESPFFDYYEVDLHPFFERRWEFLLDFNEAIRDVVCQLLDIQPCIRFSDDYREYPLDVVDLRSAINPKHPQNTGFVPKAYYQVHNTKETFRPHLSILDLLLNMGPEGIFYL